MNKEDITRMAREAGAMFDHITWVERDLFPVFARFAELVAAHERKEVLKLADSLGWVSVDDIRARGEK
jgi:hypothetical protein